ncbi:hypothetical protein K439DRAFT_844624 [Ramaria rubella]|nr:hypothetical protein K439DRAFT_844624 [Ramaria rubella]
MWYRLICLLCGLHHKDPTITPALTCEKIAAPFPVMWRLLDTGCHFHPLNFTIEVENFKDMFMLSSPTLFWISQCTRSYWFKLRPMGTGLDIRIFNDYIENLVTRPQCRCSQWVRIECIPKSCVATIGPLNKAVTMLRHGDGCLRELVKSEYLRSMST